MMQGRRYSSVLIVEGIGAFQQFQRRCRGSLEDEGDPNDDPLLGIERFRSDGRKTSDVSLRSKKSPRNRNTPGD